MESLCFTKINKDGKKVICDVIATYHDDDINKDFIFYTDNSFASNNKLNIYYSLYKQIGNDIKLINDNSLKVKKIGLEVLKELLNDITS